ncbi:Ltp family lipoprotein [Planococcus ruber]|uniref:Ltp family lipoprotein n=1 Tax=Planococcus ruber TaxID=2027871 RepID=UPI001FEED8E5|nr:Ltp family lipoprotein [Planococcus ruber]MCJ1910009.1 Ltp family lipoprotein [Planococcus ruber]
MEKQTAFFKTKWKYLLAVAIAFAVGGGIGFLQSPAHSSTIENQKKQEKLEAATKDLAAEVEMLEAANSESNERINRLKAQMKKMETPSQQQAVARAKNFLKYSPFSESGLIDQLVVEGYGEEDAAYAVDSIEIKNRR